MNTLVPVPSCKQETNIGMVVEGNAYFVADFPRYLAMSAEQLDSTIADLQQTRREILGRFLRHRTVSWFGASIAGLCLAIIFTPYGRPSLAYGIATFAWLIGAVLPSMYLMIKQREDLLNALTLLKAEIKKAKAARVTK